MKRIISLLIVCSALLSALPALASDNSDDIMPLLSELKIMVGDGDGNYRLDDKVSRAEFTKTAVAASKSKNTVAEGSKVSPFSDVTYKHWAAPYIRAAVSSGIAEGYIDATFHPDSTVTYEEALTMLLKVLGYTNDDFGFSWPYGQTGLADSLEITKNTDISIGEALTRRQVAQLVYNTLNTRMKDTQSRLISVFDCEAVKDVTVIASHNEDSSLGENKIFTTSGTYEISDSFNRRYVGMKGDIFIKNGDDAIAFIPESGSNELERYVVYSQLPNAVIGYQNGSFTQIDITDGTACYKDSARTSYGAVKNELEMGDVLYVHRDHASIDYVSYEKGSMEGPVKVTGSDWQNSFATDDRTTVMRGGVKVSAADIKINDIIYYSSELNMVLAYTDKATGVYEKASPTKDSPISVTVSGKEYSIEGLQAFNDLSSSGSFKYGDTVTLLLGRTGEVAGVAGGGAQSVSSAGFVIAAGRKDFTGADNSSHSSFYATVVSPDGNITEYETASNPESMVCAAVRVSFKNGKASLARSKADSFVSGSVNAEKGTIGKVKLSENVKILDTSGTYSDDIAGYCRVYPQRIDGVTLTSSNVLYCAKNAAGEIDELILSDVTGDTYEYGVIVGADDYSCTVDIDGDRRSYQSGLSKNLRGPHKMKTANGGLRSVVQLPHYSHNISALTRTEAEIGNQRYLLSDKVVVYKRADSYMKITLDEAINSNYRLTAYYDKPQTTGGRIRIIVAQ